MMVSDRPVIKLCLESTETDAESGENNIIW